MQIRYFSYYLRRVGAYGNPYVKTPNIDQLAHRGVRFTNNFCMGSHHGAVCAPSRAMLMSGKSLFRVYDKLEGLPTLSETLKENGTSLDWCSHQPNFVGRLLLI